MVVNSSRGVYLTLTKHHLPICRYRPEDKLNVPSTSGATRTVQHSNDGNLEVTQHPILSPGGPQLVVEVPSLDPSQVYHRDRLEPPAWTTKIDTTFMGLSLGGEKSYVSKFTMGGWCMRDHNLNRDKLLTIIVLNL